MKYLILCLLLIVSNFDFATSAESSIADRMLVSPFSSFLADGIAKNRIELAEFTANPKCMNGRIKIKEGKECGATLRGYIFKSKNPKPKALLLVVHGMQSNSSWFLSGEFLGDNDIEVLAFDRRGAGASDGIYGHVDRYIELIEDMGGALEYLRNKRTNIPMHLHANCFGTRIAVPFMQEYMEGFTKSILQDDWRESHPEATKEDLSHINGFKFVSVINTSPATHMSPLSEELLRKQPNVKCLLQFLLEDKNWNPREKCYAKNFDELDILKNGTSEFSDSERSCLVDFVRKDHGRMISSGCSDESVDKISKNEPLSAEDLECLNSTAFLNDEWLRKNACSPEIVNEIRGKTKDPNGVEMLRSPLTDNLYTTKSDFLALIGNDPLAVRELSSSFLFALDDLTKRMERWLVGRPFNGEILQSPFNSSVLMILTSNDLMVTNDSIVREYFAAHKGKSITESSQLLNRCYQCNPKVVFPVDTTVCKPEELLTCTNPNDLLVCKNLAGSPVDCTKRDSIHEASLKPYKPPRFIREDSIKKLVEIECEHFTEFCHNQSEVIRYRESMRDWLLMERWQSDWDTFFE